MNAKISMFVICVEASKYLLLHNSLECTFKKNVYRVSKVLKSSKHHNIWIYYSIIYYFSFFMFHFSYQLLQNQKCQAFIHFCSFVLNVILKLTRTFGSIKYHLRMRVKDFFLLRWIFLINAAHLLRFKWHFNECAIRKYRLFF